MAGPLPLRELTGWEEEHLARHQQDANTARTCNDVLARCCVAPGTEPDEAVRGLVRDLLVAERDLELVRLRRMSLGPHVEARVECPTCGEPNEAAFSLDDLDLDLGLPAAAERSGLVIEDGGVGEELTLALPTAGDQEDLLDTELDGLAEQRTWLLGRALRRPDGSLLGAEAARKLPLRRRAALERALDERLPALELAMEVRCAQCGAGFTAPFDVGSFFFRTDWEGRRPCQRRPPNRLFVPLVRTAGLGPAPEPTTCLPPAARGGRRRGAARRRSRHDRPGVVKLSAAAGKGWH